MSKKEFKKELATEKQIRRRTAISFLIFFLLLAAGYAGWRWLYTQPDSDGVQKPLRYGLQKDEEIFGSIFSKKTIAKNYPKEKAAKSVRVNGNIGMSNDFDYKNWRLKVLKKNGDTLRISLDEIRALPKTEVIFDFKCIEGWSQVSHWGGVRFSDFVKKYGLDKEAGMNYVGMQTPDKQYYVGIDMESMMQSQTILCYEMNSNFLPLNQGFPLRLIIPVKYGIKNIKRIGTLYFSNPKPPDYWAERGYDYYSGL
ncbi:MAG: molybdopterin-dependent oxidoreductase [Taibaiella sp.]|nr:molybdopterin-dependent oxidoreductase [Taibaiella sp.]